MMHEYEVHVTITEVHSVFVTAEDWETAEQLAEEKFNNGEGELIRESTDVKVNWSDEED